MKIVEIPIGIEPAFETTFKGFQGIWPILILEGDFLTTKIKAGPFSYGFLKILIVEVLHCSKSSHLFTSSQYMEWCVKFTNVKKKAERFYELSKIKKSNLLLYSRCRIVPIGKFFLYHIIPRTFPFQTNDGVSSILYCVGCVTTAQKMKI